MKGMLVDCWKSPSRRSLGGLTRHVHNLIMVVGKRASKYIIKSGYMYLYGFMIPFCEQVSCCLICLRLNLPDHRDP